MPLWPRRPSVDRTARDHAARIVASILDGTLEWSAVPEALGAYTGADRGVAVIFAELHSVAAESRTEPEEDPELDAILRRTGWFLRSDLRYRWSERGPAEIVGAYLGVAALAWMAVAGAGAIWGYASGGVIAGALLATLLMYVMAAAMAVALLRRLWWRYTAKRDGADRGVWPFFTPTEYRSAREPAPETEL